MRHRDRVTIHTPGAPRRHPVTGNPVAGAATAVPAVVTLTPTTSYDLPGQAATDATDWQLLADPGTPLRSTSYVVDAAGRRFDVVGAPAELASLATGAPSHVEARLRFVSDSQEV